MQRGPVPTILCAFRDSPPQDLRAAVVGRNQAESSHRQGGRASSYTVRKRRRMNGQPPTSTAVLATWLIRSNSWLAMSADGVGSQHMVSANASPSACPIIQPSSTAATESIQSLIATGAPLLRTTTVLGWTLATALISAICCLVKSRSYCPYQGMRYSDRSSSYGSFIRSFCVHRHFGNRDDHEQRNHHCDRAHQENPPQTAFQV
jgi:hypothetical protein